MRVEWMWSALDVELLTSSVIMDALLPCRSILVCTAGLMMRVARTYDLDPKVCGQCAGSAAAMVVVRHPAIARAAEQGYQNPQGPVLTYGFARGPLTGVL
eukprot:4472777-Prymnesium_polylepis.2